MTWNDTFGLLGFVLACMAAASSGAVFKPGAWYEGLAKPRWRPPNWLFPPAWLVLYLMIAVAGWLVWRKAGFAGAAWPLALYGLQLVFNAIWSWLFFGLRRMDLALVDSSLLWLTIAGLIVSFWSIEPRAALLLVPYLAWVAFATALNAKMLALNPRPAEGSPRRA